MEIKEMPAGHPLDVRVARFMNLEPFFEREDGTFELERAGNRPIPQFSRSWMHAGWVLDELCHIAADGQILRTVEMCKTPDTRDETLRLSFSVMVTDDVVIPDVMVWCDDIKVGVCRIAAVLENKGFTRKDLQ